HADLLSKRFLREVEVAARLHHPNIVTAYDAGEEHGISYLVSEFIDGQDLSELIRQYGPVPIPMAMDIILQAARALAYAHSEGIVHRDIKPSNLLLDNEGNVKLLDVGLARVNTPDGVPAAADLTSTGVMMGTVDYMSPEQALNTRLADERSDIYSLGCTLFFLLTGRSPYRGETSMERLIAHRESPLPSILTLWPECPPELDTLISHMIAKRPEERPQTAGELVRLMESLQGTGLPEIVFEDASTDDSSITQTAHSESDRTWLGESGEPGQGPASAPTVPCPALPRELLPEVDTALNDIRHAVTEAEAALIPGDASHDSLVEQPAVRQMMSDSVATASESRAAVMHSRRSTSMAWILFPGLAALILAAIVIPRILPDSKTDSSEDKSSPSDAGDLTGNESGSEQAAGETAREVSGRDHVRELRLLADMTLAEAEDYRRQKATELQVPLQVQMGDVSFEFIPPGRFYFGPESTQLVTIDRGFYLSATEITVGQFGRFDDAVPGFRTAAEINGDGWGLSPETSQWKNDGGYYYRKLGANFVDRDTPATSITYGDAVAFCRWISGETLRKITLPNEQQWEYACRCGRRGTWCFGDDESALGDYAWTRDNSNNQISPVAQKQANTWGLFDMHGNESEWCLQDETITGTAIGFVRGGGFNSPPRETASAVRLPNPVNSPAHGAFRVLMELE
ncbi:MAG: protein kinase, partial [Planctomycetaceae bacterium]|nr:protein kinase [Planctomycetaceae bacterium]